MPDRSKDIDIAVLGATGFTGGLIADYLRSAAPTDAHIAVVGRNTARLEQVAARPGAEVEIITVDATDPVGLRSVTERCRTLITTVGPYIVHGDPVVAACADTGTDYLDLTGEPEFVDRTYLLHHARAVQTGARLVHACGFDSIPHDLGAQFTVEQLPEDTALSVRGFMRMQGTFSGGTAASALEIMGRMRSGRVTNELRRAAEGEPEGRTVRIAQGRPGRDTDTGWWVVPLPTIDPQIVAESARLLPRYGPEFTYAHFWAGTSPLASAGLMAGTGLLAGIAQVPAARRAISRMRPPGTGPDEAQRQRSWFKVRFVGEGGGRRVVTEVAGGDPGYTETAKMISEAAMCLAFDELPSTAGQVTTAAAMGSALRQRLEAAGITFEIKE